MYSFGSNVFGQLGLGDASTRTFPTLSPLLTDLGIANMSCGQRHCLALTNNGYLYSWGSAMSGQLGTGSLVNQPGPVLVKFFDQNSIDQVMTGGDHSLVLDRNGEVWSFGRNNMGQLGHGTFKDSNLPLKVVNMAGIRVRMISAGFSSSILLATTGTLYLMGDNTFAQLGIGTLGGNSSIPVPCMPERKFSDVKGGFQHVLALSEGNLYAWGRNDAGQLGMGVMNTTIPIKVEIPPGQLGLGTRSQVWFPRNLNFDTVMVDGVVASGSHTFLTLSNGEIYSFGMNQYGQLASMDFVDKPYPFLYFAQKNIPIENIVLGQISSFIKSRDGTVFVVGGNENGVLGIGMFGNRPDPTEIEPFPYPIKAISAAYSHSALLGFDGSVWTFGLNHRGQLGTGDPMQRFSPTLLKSVHNITKISTGLHFTLALSEDGDIFVWGANDSGQLGVLDFNDRWSAVKMNGLTGLSISEISAGQYHTLLLTDAGEVYSTGSNTHGQLGLGHVIQQSIPRRIRDISGVKEISAGAKHSLILQSSGQMYSFGSEIEGILGIWSSPPQNRTLYQSSPRKVLHAPYIISSIDTAETHSLALTTDGTVLSWGDGETNRLTGQLGRGENPYSPMPIISKNLNGERIERVSTGISHSMLIGVNSTVFAFGSNTDRQLGLGASIPYEGTPTEVTKLRGQRAVRVSCFARHSIVLVHNMCWGKISYDPTVCFGAGACIGQDTCRCNAEYVGPMCDLTTCFGVLSNNGTVCGGNGKCTRPNTCSCNPGFSGPRCTDVSCFGIPSGNETICSAKGTCVSGDTCKCNDGYFGQACNDWKCGAAFRNDTEQCSKRGVCVGPGTCACQRGLSYIGVDCEVPFISIFGSFYIMLLTCMLLITTPLFLCDIYVISKRLNFEIKSELELKRGRREFHPTMKYFEERELTETLISPTRKQSRMVMSPSVSVDESYF